VCYVNDKVARRAIAGLFRIFGLNVVIQRMSVVFFIVAHGQVI
jgi:hypothetical protein